MWNPNEELKRCAQCKEAKSYSSFSPRKGRTGRAGFIAYCKICMALRQRLRWAALSPEQRLKFNARRLKLPSAAKSRQASLQYKKDHKAELSVKGQKYKHANRGRYNAIQNARRAQKLHATPAWAELDSIRDIYLAAAELSRTTGVSHEVDHIVPLRHASVCGLHVLANLQILTKEANSKKGNSFS